MEKKEAVQPTLNKDIIRVRNMSCSLLCFARSTTHHSFVLYLLYCTVLSVSTHDKQDTSGTTIMTRHTHIQHSKMHGTMCWTRQSVQPNHHHTSAPAAGWPQRQHVLPTTSGRPACTFLLRQLNYARTLAMHNGPIASWSWSHITQGYHREPFLPAVLCFLFQGNVLHRSGKIRRTTIAQVRAPHEPWTASRQHTTRRDNKTRYMSERQWSTLATQPIFRLWTQNLQWPKKWKRAAESRRTSNSKLQRKVKRSTQSPHKTRS